MKNNENDMLPFIYILVYFYIFFAMLHNLRDLSFLTRNQTHAPCNGSVHCQPLAHRSTPYTF